MRVSRNKMQKSSSSSGVSLVSFLVVVVVLAVMPLQERGGRSAAAAAAALTASTAGTSTACKDNKAKKKKNLQSIEMVTDPNQWFADRTFGDSANKVLNGQMAEPLTCTIFRPESAQEIARILQSTDKKTPIAIAGGGHESSNAAAVASSEAVIVDMIKFKSIVFHDGDLVTVGAGVFFQELVEAVVGQHGALPVGTGPTITVAGYIMNGGLSGYMSRRLGLLGQRVTQMTVVTADGVIRTLTPQDALFIPMLGAGSALAVVVDITLQLASETTVQSADQIVAIYNTRDEAVQFTRQAMTYMRDVILPDDSMSIEVVVTGTNSLVWTLIFYDTFTGNTADILQPLQDIATSLNLPIVAESHWTTWYEVASALWPVIAGLNGNPLAALYHSVGTENLPPDQVLDYVADVMVAQTPWDEAPLSLIEIRALGGAIQDGIEIPTGNFHHEFFVDVVVLYDAQGKTSAERQAIVDQTKAVIDQGRGVDGLIVDFSGTHSQPDDPNYIPTPLILGTQAMTNSIKLIKSQVDPYNRFRFHPFAKLLP